MVALRLDRGTRPGDRLVSSDELLALALALGEAAEAGVSLAASLTLRLVGVIAAGGFLALSVRRRYPLGALAVVVATVLVSGVAVPQVTAVAQFLALLLASYSLGAHEPSRRRLLPGMALAGAGVTGGVLLSPPSPHSKGSSLAFFLLLLVVVPVAAGRLVRMRSQLVSRLREATERLESTRAARVSAAVSGERARLAGELEPVVLAGLEAMREHAEAQSLGAVEALERTARQTLASMRGLLSRLRAPAGSMAPELDLSELRVHVQRLLDHAEPATVTANENSRDTSPPRVARWTLVPSPFIDATLASIAVASGAGLGISAASHSGFGGLWAVALAVAIPLPLAVARRWPLASASVAFSAAIVYALTSGVADPLAGPSGLAVVPGIAIGARCDLRRALLGLAICAAGEATVLALDAGSHPSGVDWGVFAAILLAGWALGRALHEHARLVRALAETGVALEHERRLQEHQSVAAERARIARELHDAVAHSLTIVLLQAAAARRVWRSDAARAREHVAALHHTVAQTLGGLRELVVEVALGQTQSEPRLEHLGELAALARSAGLRVELVVEPDATATDADVELAVCRIIQEALTNAARHAPGATTEIRVRRDGTELLVEAENGPPSHQPTVPITGGGHGLRGMRERALACGGDLEAGPRGDGGFTVRARLASAPGCR